MLKYLLYLTLLVYTTIGFGQIEITETLDEGQEAFKISTPNSTFYYQKEAGGFSSILDKNGKDWLNFTTYPKNTFPASAASDYRGLPNLVFQGEDGGAGHPGFNQCISTLENQTTIVTTSKSGKWKWKWHFDEEGAELEIIDTDRSRKYWFLFEGTPAGQWNMQTNLWGTDQQGLRKDVPDFIKTEGVFENWNWVYFGDKNYPITFYIQHVTSDHQKDVMGYMGNTLDGIESPDGMVVFGFGRGPKTQALLSGNHRFKIGFVPKKITKKNTYKSLKSRLQ